MPPALRSVRLASLNGVPRPTLAAAAAWAYERTRTPGLMLTGPIGVGKTWVAAAAATAMAERRRIGWCSVARMMVQISASFGDEQRAEAIAQLVGDWPLVLDDLDKANPTAWTKQHIYAALDNRIVAEAPLLVTTNLSLAALRTRLGDAICSRLEGYFRVVRLEGTDRRHRAYLREQARRGF